MQKNSDFSNNRLADLPSEMGGLRHLREVILSINQFPSIPGCLYDCPKLETILIANNRITCFEVEKLSNLYLQNNAIQTVSPELGNLSQIRTLQLEGNLFRVPRAAILVQGIGAVLAYLRDRRNDSTEGFQRRDCCWHFNNDGCFEESPHPNNDPTRSPGTVYHFYKICLHKNQKKIHGANTCKAGLVPQ